MPNKFQKENIKIMAAKAMAYDNLFKDKKISEDTYINYFQSSLVEIINQLNYKTFESKVVC